jgi:hypothetical protein
MGKHSYNYAFFLLQIYTQFFSFLLTVFKKYEVGEAKFFPNRPNFFAWLAENPAKG